jgi:hypothetical protein
MSRVEAAAADRLPWLPDEPAAKPVKRGGHAVLGWAATAIGLVAAGAFWLGMRSVHEQATPMQQAAPTTTMPLPVPREVQPEVRLPAQPQVNPTPVVEFHPAPVREVRIPVPRLERSAKAEESRSAPVEEESQPVAASEAEKAAPPTTYAPPTPWNPRIFAGAAGRVVQIGAFGSTHQAKLGWRYMVRAYPAVAHLPAVVRTTRNSKGRDFYRFQIGTTSQAHSEVLCQRMQRIHFSCAVVDLPWKAKVER